MSVHVTRIALTALLIALLTPTIAAASESPGGSLARAHAGQAGRIAYSATMMSAGAAMLPITVESIIAGDIEGSEAPGFLVTAALLGLGGVPLLAASSEPLASDPLAGPRARVRLAREGVLAYAIFGSMFTSIGTIVTALKASKTGDVPVDLRVYDVASVWLLATAIGLAADGDLARLQLPADQRRARQLDHLGGPLLAYGLIMMTLVTPSLRLSMHGADLPLQPTLLPMLTGVAMFTAGLCLLVAEATHKRRGDLAQRPPRHSAPRGSFPPCVDPAGRAGGLAVVGRF